MVSIFAFLLPLDIIIVTAKIYQIFHFQLASISSFYNILCLVKLILFESRIQTQARVHTVILVQTSLLVPFLWGGLTWPNIFII
jgi:hypothetical protein